MKLIFSKSGRRSKAASVLRFIVITLSMSLLLTASIAGGAYYYIVRSLPRLESLKDYRPKVVSTVYSDDGTVIAEFFTERRVVIPFSKIPKVVINAFVASEDGRFFEHKGINLVAILRATMKNIEAGGVVQGGSTITQQVVKSLLLSSERSVIRKLKEAILAHRIEKNFSKEDILSLYLNEIYLGEGAYGVEAASMTFFGKHIDDVTLPEAAMLAGLPRSPSRYSPISHFDKARERQLYVLERMREEGYITREEETKASGTNLYLRTKEDISRHVAPYFTEHIRRHISEKYGNDVLLGDGLIIHTTLNVKAQDAANKAIKEGLKEIDKRLGYRGSQKRIKQEEIAGYMAKEQERLSKKIFDKGDNVEGIVLGMEGRGKVAVVAIGEKTAKMPLSEAAWAGSNPVKTGDIILLKITGINPKTGELLVSLDQEPEIQGALVTIDPYTGYVTAMVGGYDYRKSEFNRAVQSRRQPGSAFKPIIYSAALDKGYTPASIIIDSPLIFEDAIKGDSWKPKNFDAEFFGPTTFRDALIHSRNVISIKILKDIGIDYLMDFASTLGIDSPLNRDLSLALGSSGVSLMELTTAYGVFAAQGDRAEPIFITKIVDREGRVLEENYPVLMNVVSKANAYIMTNLMEGVIQSGTGQAAKALGRPAAGKTGTTNELSDAWFVGFTPDTVTGVWVGYDELKPLGKTETGGRAAAPIWTKTMIETLSGTPVRGFTIPDDVVFVRIDKETGLLASTNSRDVLFECFIEGTEPTEFSTFDKFRALDFYRYESGEESIPWAKKTAPEHEME